MRKVLYVNGKFLSQPVTGVQRYALGVMTAWDKALACGLIDPSQYVITILAPSNSVVPAPFQHIRVEISSRFRGKLWEQVYLPFRSRGNLLFSPYAAAPILKRKHVVTIHDAGVSATPRQYSPMFRRYYRLAYSLLGRIALTIFTVSDFSRSELHKYYSIRYAKIIVARPGYEPILSHPPDASILATHKLEPGRYILGVSSQSPIKNFDTLVRAWKRFDRTDIRLVIAGGYNTRLFGKRPLADMDESMFLGYVTDGELRSLYENAACFVYPSLYEGFGLPPLEAMACQCPVVVSTCAALPETCAGAALYCAPFDVAGFSRSIGSIVDDPALAASLRRKGSGRIKELTYRNCAAVLWNSILELL